MTDILTRVTPHTRGIIWLNSDLTPERPNYKAIDYLLNGLLTATLAQHSEAPSYVMHSTNFHGPLKVFIVRAFNKAEYEAYLVLLRPDLQSESTVLVIDETDGYEALAKSTHQDLRASLHRL